MKRWIAVLLCTLFVVSCGTTATADQPTPQVITKVVTQVVIVTQVVTATPKPATATPKASPTAAATATPKVEPTATPLATGKWQSSIKASSFDDSQTVALLLDADSDISGPSGDTRPSLLVRCKEHQKDAYVITGMAPDVESGNLDGATVRVRFDKEAAATMNTDQSTSHDTLFFHDPDAIIAAMLKHERMVFGFTPFNASPTEMTFDLRGLSEAIGPLNKACK